MENEKNDEKKNDPKDQARNLFFESGLTQAQIAELIGVSQKTISIWMNEGRWKQLKETAELAPAVLIEQMISELSEIHYNIASREPGKRFPTPQEADTRRKIMTSIKQLKEHQSAGVHAEVMMNFLRFVRKINPGDAKIVAEYAQLYMAGTEQSLNPAYKLYPLPGQVEIPAPSGLPAGKTETAPPPTDEKDKPADLDQAA